MDGMSCSPVDSTSPRTRFSELSVRHRHQAEGIVRLLWADSRNYRYFLRCSSVVERCEKG